MNNYRRQDVLTKRILAAELASNRPHPRHIANGDEQKFRTTDKDGKNKPSYLASFTKGMPHDSKTGLLLEPEVFQNFVKGVDSGDPRDFQDTKLGPASKYESEDGSYSWRTEKANTSNGGCPVEVRAWESQGAGHTHDLEGPDASAVTMPPAPALGSAELSAEMAEVYAQALLRDVPFTEISSGEGAAAAKGKSKPKVSVKEIVSCLNDLSWFKDQDCCDLTDAEQGRKRKPLTSETAFRGITRGDNIGPYISQFMLAGNTGVNGHDKPEGGYIGYGALRIDQRVSYALEGDDHMLDWESWLDVQDGADLRGHEKYHTKGNTHRFITTPRDLATYVHHDALYESYLNACLLMLGMGIPFDPDIPFQRKDRDDHQQGFAHFGGPHILSLVTEVATRALKAVRFQKFNIHRRLRPEVLAARLSKHKHLDVKELNAMVDELQPMLDKVRSRNETDQDLRGCNYLLPMAFCEGSPMHPAYGAGHATVAGACVTVLKAFFDSNHPLDATMKGANYAFVPCKNGMELEAIKIQPNCELTVEGELNKLASNISIGRNWAGVHYFSDYIESLRMGEQIAIGILEEQKLMYGENFSMTIPLFDGGTLRV